ncbi:ATP-dependent helicase [Gramella sp. GC03-9]|uniref:DNA 3'-5' helicase n=1 Tax=Christiangramia oceanisediminis TaxID=2920386 RepID=A0A9X2RC78_9FLAO|nr:ATP-dependent helicase [Gramella oceanisediminis]MCP9200815.1 ATP-dependent helicase [Gramella oceanisediminis]
MDLSELNSNQQKAVTFEGKHLLVLAGAGTGKTKTIISRAAYLISQGVDPGKIQILTFTKRAASEIINRVKANLDNSQAKNLNGSTFHSWCNQLLTKFPNLFGTKSFTVIDQDDQVSIMKLVCGNNYVQYEDLRIKAEGLIDLYSFARNTKKSLSDTIRLKLFNNLNDEDTVEKIKLIKPKIEVLLRGYEQKKKERKYLDYDDMLLVVAIRLNKDPEARRVVSSQYEHILVDEMQDTNPLQWDLLNPFQKICHLYCVGDDAQSIYSFRGADFKNVHSFKERVENSEVYKLDQNYRSTQEILDISNWLLEQSPIEYGKELISVRGDGSVPEIINVENEWEEADFISETIIENFTKNNKTYKDHLILSRSQYYTRSLQATFIKNKIPYVTYGGRKFMESAHIKDMVSALRVVNNKDDEIAWMRYLSIWEGIGEIKAARYTGELLFQKSIEDCIDWLKSIILENDGKIIADVIETIAKNRDNLKEAVDGSFHLMEERLAFKYRKDWENKRKGDFPVLGILAKNYSTLGEFITECTLDNATDINNSPVLADSFINRSEDKDHVIISTIHSAKGLESDVCFVLNVSPKAFPSSWTLGNIDEVEEERRVLYVAMTRAKNQLFITRNIHSLHAQSSSSVQNNGEIKPLQPETYFLHGLPEEMVEQSTKERFEQAAKDIEEPNKIDLSSGMDFS